jgi:hypothetical protein
VAQQFAALPGTTLSPPHTLRDPSSTIASHHAQKSRGSARKLLDGCRAVSPACLADAPPPGTIPGPERHTIQPARELPLAAPGVRALPPHFPAPHRCRQLLATRFLLQANITPWPSRFFGVARIKVDQSAAFAPNSPFFAESPPQVPLSPSLLAESG